MADRPIIMSGEMVRAIMAGRKTQTRRVLKPQPPRGWNLVGIYAPGLTAVFDGDPPGPPDWALPLSYRPGQRLWVRETCRAEELPCGADGVRYLADDHWRKIQSGPEAGNAWSEMYHYRGKGKDRIGNKVPAIHMPRWASRITLHVTDVRVQRLAEITDDDAIAEGVEYYERACQSRVTYAKLWDSLNAKRGFPWQSNPWVCALQFRTELNSDRYLR